MVDTNEEKIKDPDKNYPENLNEEEGTEDVVELAETGEQKEQDLHMAADQAHKIRTHLENIDLDDDVKMQAHSHASDLQSLDAKGKIQKLLQTARQKGVIFAVAVAKKMGDPYILDIFHDALAKEGLYKDFKL